MKRIHALAVGLLFCLPLGAAASFGHGSSAFIGGRIFPLTTSENLNELRIQVTASSIGRVGAVRLENREDRKVFCRALFYSGPERIGRRQVYLAPGQSAILAKTAWRVASRMNIAVTCSEP